MGTITKENLLHILKKHDWYYEYSDDFSVWEKGKDSLFKLKQTLKEVIKSQPELKNVIKEFYEEKMVNPNSNFVYSVLENYF